MILEFLQINGNLLHKDENCSIKQLAEASLRNVDSQVAGWGRTEDGVASETLQSTELTYVSTNDCLDQFSHQLKRFITPDKFCGQMTNGKFDSDALPANIPAILHEYIYLLMQITKIFVSQLQ